MRIELSETAGFTVIRPDGPLFAAEDGWRLGEKIIQVLESDHNVILDLTACTFLNTAGLGELVRALTRAAVVKKTFRLCGVGGRVRNLLEITKLVKVFEIYQTVEEALVGPVEKS